MVAGEAVEMQVRVEDRDPGLKTRFSLMMGAAGGVINQCEQCNDIYMACTLL